MSTIGEDPGSRDRERQVLFIQQRIILFAMIVLAFGAATTMGGQDPITTLYRQYARASEERKQEEAAVARLRTRALQAAILEILRNTPREGLNRDLDDADLGKEAVQNASRRLSQTPSNGPNNPNPGNPDLEWEFPCKVKYKQTIRTTRAIISLQAINICELAIYACVGNALLKCPADQDMRCIQWALEQKCAFF